MKTKIKVEQLEEILKERYVDKIPREEVAKKYNVSETTISMIPARALEWGVIGWEKYCELTDTTRIKDNQLEEMIRKRKEGVRIKIIRQEYGISETTYIDCLDRAVELKIISEQEKRELVEKGISERGDKALTYEDALQLLEDKRKGMKNKELRIKHGIKTSAINRYMRELIGLGDLTKEEYIQIQKNIQRKSMHDRIEKNPAMLSKMGKEGGAATQREAPYVQYNLDRDRPYGSSRFTYDGVGYGSKTELKLGLMLKAAGRIRKIIPEKNFQVDCDGLKIDYVININNEKWALEYHREKDNGLHYRDIRPEKLAERGWTGRIAIFEERRWYEKFKEIGIVQNLKQYHNILEKAEKELKDAMELVKAGVPF
jgi:hypothetical protein